MGSAGSRHRLLSVEPAGSRAAAEIRAELREFLPSKQFARSDSDLGMTAILGFLSFPFAPFAGLPRLVAATPRYAALWPLYFSSPTGLRT
jgi:hypothetical protein